MKDAISSSWLSDQTITGLQAAMDDGQLTASALVWHYLERIAAFDKNGPKINAVLEVNPDALALAAALDRERQQLGSRGPLHGIPVLVKDNIDTADKMHTSAGSLALANSYAEQDSFVAKKLRQAGAIILGKANMTEWANFMTVGMKNGYSSRGGQVQNPYGPGKFDVGGSSSGSGAAVASGFCTAAIGTETSGSILSPASSNSVVGIKPTVGLISRRGIIPIAHSQDTAGPIARTVKDAAILLGALAGEDELDPATMHNQGRYPQDYRPFLNTEGLQGTRIGIPRGFYERLDDERLQLIDQAIADLLTAGAEIVDPVEMPAAQGAWQSKVLLHEFKVNLNAYLGRLSPQVPVHSLRELIAYNQANAESMLKYGQTLLIDSEATSGSLADPEYINCRREDLRRSIDEGIDWVLQAYQLDALLFPGNFGAGIAARAGYPSITVPAGYTQAGLPMGATFTARAFEEPKLIQMAYAYEQATGHRRPPTL
ncbi:MAG: amidase family protein [Bacillota bacterium]